MSIGQAASQPTETASPQQAPSLGQKLLLLIFAVLLCIVAFVGLDAAYSFLFRKSAVPTPSEIFGCLGRDPLRALALQPYCSCTRAWGSERYALNIGRRSRWHPPDAQWPRDHITVRSLDGLFSQRSAVEAQIGHSLGKALSVQLGDQRVNDVHETSCLS